MKLSFNSACFVKNFFVAGEQKVKFICTSNCMVCRAITDQLPEENLNSLVIARAFRRGLLQNYSNFQRAIYP